MFFSQEETIRLQIRDLQNHLGVGQMFNAKKNKFWDEFS